jgi:hypothetical protein
MAAYVTVDEIKRAMSDAMPANNADYDALFGELAERASRLIDRITGRDENAYAAANPEARLLKGSGQNIVVIEEAFEVVKVETTVDYVTWDEWDANAWWAGPYQKSPFWQLTAHPIFGFGYFPIGERRLRVTAKWGYSLQPPQVVKQAAIMQAVRWFKRGQSAFGDAFANAELGGLQFAKKVDPEIETLILNSGLRRYAL